MYRKREKIRVEIVGGYLPKKRNCTIEGNYVIINPNDRNRDGASYKAFFDNTCLIPYKTGLPPFRSIRHKLMLKEGSAQCVSFSSKQEDKAPSCTIQDVENYATATVIKKAGSFKEESKTLIYVLIIINIIVSLAGLIFGGRIRF